MAKQTRDEVIGEGKNLEALATMISGQNPDGSAWGMNSAKGAKTFSAVAPTTSAASVLAANSGRVTAVIYNAGSQTVYLGKNGSVTTSNGLPLAAGASLTDEETTDAWFGITASGTGDLRIVEVA